MNKFADVIRQETSKKYTENGQIALSSTGTALLDLFATGGSLRTRPEVITEKFKAAFEEDPLIATKIMFYIRDIRGGLGEREVFRRFLTYAANKYPDSIIPNINLIPVYGRFDDWYALRGTPLESKMVKVMKEQFEEDLLNLHIEMPVSLLGKWIATPDASSKATAERGIWTARALGYDVYTFKRLLRILRQRIDVVEVKMCANKWDKINYSGVPSKAMNNYRNAFCRHDAEGFYTFMDKVEAGVEEIKASTLYPYDIVGKVLNDRPNLNGLRVLEAQWKALPDYLDGKEINALVVADTSGSMCGRPIATSIGLAMYFAERNKGAFHNMFMSFSANPKFHYLKGETLFDRVRNLDKTEWDNNTDLRAAFMKVLELAVANRVPKEEMIKSLIVVSDMEIDGASRGFDHNGNMLFHDEMKQIYAAYGYTLPNIVYWNVESRNDTFHTNKNAIGVQMFSGQSLSTFKNALAAIGLTPIEAMYQTINSARYSEIRYSR